LALIDEKDGGRRRKSGHDSDHKAVERSQPRKKHADVPEVGNALRTAYQQTVNEDIPPEMLDLLGKLG
jgi:hypothetical protein